MTTVPHATGAGNRLVGNRLVIVAPNWLGDAVMALPAIADVCRARPGAALVVASRRSVAPLFMMVPGVTSVIDVAGPDLRSGSFDTAILLPNSFHAAFTAWRAGIPDRWGYRTQGRAPLLTRGVARGPRVHQAAYYQRLTDALGFPGEPARPHLQVAPEVRQAAIDQLEGAGWSGAPLVAMAPGASNGRAKQWPPESYAGVTRALAHDGVTTVLVGSPADAVAGADLVAAARDVHVINLIGQTDLRALAGVLVHCRALLCNDSGAMHLAAALDVPVTAMFGPTKEQETGPLGQATATVLTHDVWCRPCMLRECPLDHGCMRGITVERALEATRPLLVETRT